MLYLFFFFFFNDTATTEIYTLSLHDALPISVGRGRVATGAIVAAAPRRVSAQPTSDALPATRKDRRSIQVICRSEEHTSELQSQSNLVCRLLLEKKKKQKS